MLSRWQHVERFPAIQAALLYEFSHSIAQMVVASYLADAGNEIGFAAPRKDGGRSPDLFINFSAFARHSLEVKAPSDLQWPHSMPSKDRLRRILVSKLKESRGQIGQLGGGLLVIGASIADARFRQLSEEVVRTLITEGGAPSRVSAIAIMNITPHSTFSGSQAAGRVSTEAEVFAIVNPRYAGPGQVVVG